LGAVPIGIPLISGPAVLTTGLLLAGLYGRLLTSIALVANVALTGLLFVFSQPMIRLLGRTGTKTISKVAGLLLAAIAVMLIRRGITEILTLPPG
jgi:multiple antibiotic resistance protein